MNLLGEYLHEAERGTPGRARGNAGGGGEDQEGWEGGGLNSKLFITEYIYLDSFFVFIDKCHVRFKTNYSY
jgi:hypothetical protein